MIRARRRCCHHFAQRRCRAAVEFVRCLVCHTLMNSRRHVRHAVHSPCTCHPRRPCRHCDSSVHKAHRNCSWSASSLSSSSARFRHPPRLPVDGRAHHSDLLHCCGSDCRGPGRLGGGGVSTTTLDLRCHTVAHGRCGALHYLRSLYRRMALVLRAPCTASLWGCCRV